MRNDATFHLAVKDSGVTSATSSSYVSLEASEDEGYVCCEGCPACSKLTNPPYAYCRGCNDDWMTFVSLEASEEKPASHLRAGQVKK